MELIEREGKLDFILFENPASQYVVGRFTSPGSKESFIGAGRLVHPIVGRTYTLSGQEVEHKKYGRQFAITHGVEVLPTAQKAIIRFLSSSRFPGVGRKAAGRIYDHFGEETLQILAAAPEKIWEVPDLKAENRQTVAEQMQEYAGDSEGFAQLFKMGLSEHAVSSLQKTYEKKVLDVIEKDPFQPYYDIYGFGYASAVQLADGLNVPAEDERRLRARINEQARNMVMKEGHTYVTFAQLYDHFLGLPPVLFEGSLDYLQQQGVLSVHQQQVYPFELYEDEEEIALALADHDYPVQAPGSRQLNELIDSCESLYHIHYDEVQKEAIRQFFHHSLFIINGGPGTGKSTIVHAIITLIKRLYPQSSIEACAPTGRAAKRLSDLAGLKAHTIHSLLRWNKDDNTFIVNEDNPLDCQFLICDEFSMVDTHLFASLLKALPDGCRILLIGDEEQLESVGPGKVFNDILDWGGIRQVHLEKIFRQSSGSGIIELASQIHHEQPLTFEDGVEFVDCETQEILPQLMSRLDPEMDLDEMQVLAPKYKGKAGINAMNEAMQELFNPPGFDKAQLKVQDTIFREGDKVMLLKNMTEEEVFNGDIGYISRIDQGSIHVEFGSQVVSFDSDLLSHLALAYCVSVHKAQGSEFQKVFCIVSDEARWMMNKRLLYTAISRAKKELVILGSRELFTAKARTRSHRQRATSLAGQLKSSWPQKDPG